ncbi:molybdopterin cofactor-binding domain-containing protein [Novosphingobium sp. 9U]|uniref:molybdopterin cofactor-binding domain-containing protein n=1 Tax=Novosphingobium sp. 9U TaxID=2653158 RepID=UPI0012F2F9F6|nr:molybdopterin cofactor-binding domain-containing protein [Novosphingobium sp. 9U]VWX53079.1 Isoquinoline 1-oxidoreductase beta subunit [Novosphingobium sp. 9U]
MASRRGVLVGGLAGGALVVGYMVRPRRYALPLTPGKDEVAFDAWIKLAADGVVTVAVPQVEMGQGVTTLIPQVAAQELGADWRQIAVEPAPISPLYANVPLAAQWAELTMPATPGWLVGEGGAWVRRWAQDHAFTVTADGTALAAYEAQVRNVAASLRALLCMAAASRWNVAWQECGTAKGFVVHEGKRLPFGPLASLAARFDPPGTPPLRAEAPGENPDDLPAGSPQTFPRLDLPAKVDGSLVFAGDVRLPGMVHASIRHGPIGAARLAGYDKEAAHAVRGLITLVHNPEWIAAVATNWWAADTALSRIDAGFSATDRADSSLIDEAMDKAMQTGDATRIHSRGDPDSYLSGRLPLQLRYEVAPALHATIETASATAHFHEGRLELWVGTQAPQAARAAAASALGIDPLLVTLYPMPLGGSFDRRLEHDHVVEAALVAKECGRPVQLMWSRKQEHIAGRPRTPVIAVLGANVDPAGRLGGLRARIAAPPAAKEFGRRLLHGDAPLEAIAAVRGEADAMVLAGAVPPYAIEHLAIDHVPAEVPLPSGRMRGNAHGYTAFFTESFVDELAHRAGREPLAYRMAMLGNDPRLAECLQRVAALSGWGGGADNSGQGIACHVIGEGRIAVVASARRDADGVRVDKLSAVADIGRIVNVDIARQQIEGGLVFGLGLALGCSTAYEAGLPVTGRLGALGLPVLADCPSVEVAFVKSVAEPADPGELGVAAVAPAVANALFSATGLRLRQLPLLSEDV